MTRTDEPALLLASVDGIKAELAKNLLGEAGIPVIAHGPDFDVAELGSFAHNMLRGTNLFVRSSELERAREILREAWGDDAL